MTPPKRKFTRKQRANIAREERDYVRFSCLVNATNGDLTPKDQEWVLSKSDQNLAFLLALEDCYKNFTTHGIRQGNCSPNEWAAWLTRSRKKSDTLKLYEFS
jgi:hypothetical protein